MLACHNKEIPLRDYFPLALPEICELTITFLQPDVKTAALHETIAFARFFSGRFVNTKSRRRNMPYKRWSMALLALAGIVAATGIVAAQPRRAPGECGENKYWDEGRCVDARDRKGTKTWAEEMLAKHWKP
jgi:hypothetical protein